VEALIETAVGEASSPTLAQMADIVSLSITHFVRALRQHTGSTPHKYLVRRRMDRAVSLLRVAQIPIGDVVDKVGFSTPAHSVATFRAAMGVTLGAVRDGLPAEPPRQAAGAATDKDRRSGLPNGISDAGCAVLVTA
jgi:AraC-like DNA-binding protein